MKNEYQLFVLKNNLLLDILTDHQCPLLIEKLNLLGKLSGSNKTINFESLSCIDQLQTELQPLAAQYQIDIVLRNAGRESLPTGLIIMDMDSTLVQTETIDEIARVAGVGDKVAAITESAMRGELDFNESLIARVSMLKGISIEVLEKVHSCLPLTAGAIELLKKAKTKGCYTALVSGGFTYFAEPLSKSLGIDFVLANSLEIVNNKLSGKVVGDIVDAESKRETLLALQHKLSLKTEQIIAIGDGANDLLMLAEAGLGIAYHAKPKVQEEAKVLINHNDLSAITCLLS